MAKSMNAKLGERVALYGIETLSDAELLAVTTGISRDQLQGVLDRYSVYEIMTSLDVIEMRHDEKIRLEAVFLLSRRLSRAQFQGGVTIRRPEDIGPLFVRELQFKSTETVLIAALNIRNKLIRIEPIATGGVGSAMICPRECARVALRFNASALVIGHNHPSGDATPSQEDIDTTKRLAESLNMLNLRLLDHLIVAGSDFISLRQQGLF